MQLLLLLQLEGEKNPSAMCLFGLCRKISGELLGGRKSLLVGEVNGRQWS